MLASKYLYDEGEDEERFNDDWARAGKDYYNFVVALYYCFKTVWLSWGGGGVLTNLNPNQC